LNATIPFFISPDPLCPSSQSDVSEDGFFLLLFFRCVEGDRCVYREVQPKPKPKLGPVPRLSNGPLNVDRTKGKYMRAIKQNTQTPLLQLRRAIRMMIWNHTLDGHMFDVKTRTTLGCGGRTRGMILTRTSTDQPENCFTLLRVCRLLYAETCVRSPGLLVLEPKSVFRAARCLE
jgi:hypothetical protein